MRALPLLLILTVLAGPARAQDAAGDVVCGTDLTSEAFREAVAAYAAARDAGRIPIARKTAGVSIGERRTFYVLETGWQTRQFELFDATGDYNLWVDVPILEEMSNAQKAVLTDLEEAMGSSTPEASFRPDHGIVSNETYLFGGMPDYDGDGLLDILMYDIEPANTAGPWILGYVSATDISPNAGPGQGNQRDVLYLDAKQGITSLDRLAGVAAHELAHLIHLGILGSGTEITFIMEGLAEYAMLANGYRWRRPTYLTDGPELNQHLFGWRQELEDYERASHFFGYIGERVGPEITGGIMRERARGPTAVEAGLSRAGLTLSQVVRDFHTANLLNDRTLSDAFGSGTLERTGIRAIRPVPVDGNGSTRTQQYELPVEGGSVRYFIWRDVSDFGIRFSTSAGDPGDLLRFNARIRGRLVITRPDGSGEWHDVAPGDGETRFAGPFDEAMLILTNTSGDARFTPISVDFVADWQAVSTAFDATGEVPVVVTLGQNYPNPFNPSTVVPFSLSAPGRARVTVHDVLGRRVMTLLDASLPAGRHEVRFDAGTLPGGSYAVVLESGTAVRTRIVTLLR